MPTEKTTKEVRTEFIENVRSMVSYWDGINISSKEKLFGLAHSILATIDGCGSMCGFILAPCPAEGDKEYNIEEEMDYYPENFDSNVKCDIAGGLHEYLHENIQV